VSKRAKFNQTHLSELLTQQLTKLLTRLPRVIVLLGVLLGGASSCQDVPYPEQSEAGVLDQTGMETQPQASDLAPLSEAAESTREQKRLILDLRLPESNDPIADETLDFSKAKDKAQPDYFATENQQPEEKKKLAVGARVISKPSLETHYEEWVKGAEIKIEVQTGQKKPKN
jgi:hypothetical protein